MPGPVDLRAGAVARTVVPRPGAESMRSWPPTAAIRSAMLASPAPVLVLVLVMPVPSSVISQASPLVSWRRVTVMRARSPACLAALCSASRQQK